MEKYDTIIIGFGKGGKTLAAYMSQKGLKVAVVEKSPKMYGGTCINIGCIPTKTLVHMAKDSTKMGFPDFEQKADFYRKSIEKKDAIIDGIRQKNYDKLAVDSKNVTVIDGAGSFVSSKVVRVKTAAGDKEITAGRIFINTGADTFIPHIDGLRESKRVYTSTSIMELKELPRHLVIIGGGYIGLEFASMYASFGSSVTVVEGNDTLIPAEDRDIAQSVKEVLEKKNVTFVMGAEVTSLLDTEECTRVNLAKDGKTAILCAEAILVSTGRRPYTEGLNLEAAGVALDARGAIQVDDKLRTTAPGIWAMGDVKGGLQFTYISLDDFRIIRDQLFGKNERNTEDRYPVPYTVFIEPPLSRIGMSETQAVQAGKDVKITKIPAAAFPRTKTFGQTDGLLKAVTDAKTGKILGCTLFCADSQEVINTVALAMENGMDYKILRDAIYTHPSMSESLNDLFDIPA